MAIALAQAAVTNTATNTTGVLGLTLGSPTTAGNCLVVLVGCNSTGQPYGNACTLGGSGTGWTWQSSASNETSDLDCVALTWINPNIAGGQTAISVNSFGSAGTYYNAAVAYEFSGLVKTSPVDKQIGTNIGVGTSWTSTATQTTTLPVELWFGLVAEETTSAVITGPSSPWTNTAQLGVSGHLGFMAGYQIVAATGAATYAGTTASSVTWAAAAFTLKGTVALPAVSVSARQAVKRASYY